MLPPALPIRFVLNTRASSSLPYGPRQKKVLNREDHVAAFREISSWPVYAPTPLRSLPGLAGALGLEAILVKDEGNRMELGSFKALGGIYGVARALKEYGKEGVGGSPVSGAGRTAPSTRRSPSDFTVTCASAGNHGKAVARGAYMFGCSAVVFLPSDTSPHRVRAIESLGARIVAVPGRFDDAVLSAAREAREKGWVVVADTTFPGHAEAPRHIMQGYTVMAREILEQTEGLGVPTHVFLQAGVGGLAAAIAGHFWETLGPARPRVVVVEPAEADGFLESALAGVPSPSSGSLQTSMECLACRNISDLAWAILEDGADAFLTVSDHAVEETVAMLEKGWNGDPPIFTQPSGAAGMAGLLAAVNEPSLTEPLDLGRDSRILIIGSEGPP